MSLQNTSAFGYPLSAQVAPKVATTSGHTCLTQGKSCDIQQAAHSGITPVIGSYLKFGIGIARAVSSCSEAAGTWTETDSAANQFGAPESVKDPRGTFPLFVARVCPSRICRISG